MNPKVFSKSRQILESTFATAWANTTPVAYDNAPFKQPADGRFVRVTMVRGDSEQLNLGSVKGERQHGVMMIQIFAPKNTGTATAEDLADQAAEIFRMKQFMQDPVTVNCRNPKQNQVGSRADFYQLNLVVPFEADGFFN